MHCYKLTLAYDGARFSGWQRQPGQRTVEGELDRAWQEIVGGQAHFHAAGRTDAGVHAQGQVVSVATAVARSPNKLLLGLNAILPDDVVVRCVQHAPIGFHATHDAKLKQYRYALFNDRRRPLWLRGRAWHVPSPLDVAGMRQAGQALVGTHDFASFQSSGSPRDSTVRTIFSVCVREGGAGEGSRDAPASANDLCGQEQQSLIAIDVEGDGFLYHMVRTIAGTLVAVGRGRRDADWIKEVLAAGDRRIAGQTAPPHGLTLMRVEY